MNFSFINLSEVRDKELKRNLSIYLAYRILNKTQAELARQFKLSDTRIAQIIYKMEGMIKSYDLLSKKI